MSRQQKKYLLIGLLLLLFAAIKLLLLWWWQNHRPQTAATDQTLCRPAAPQGCTFSGSQTLYLQGVGHNKTPFTVIFDHLPAQTQAVSVSFDMQDMDMGFNRFDLTQTAPGQWRIDKVHLPLCTAKQHNWIITWQIDGQSYSATFQTHPQ